MLQKWFGPLVFALSAWCGSQVAVAAAPQAPQRVSLSIDAEETLGTIDPRRLGGTNIALWNEVRHFQSPELRQWITELNPGYLRLPGGSWSNSIYWNGNGVRDAQGKIDPSRVGPDGFPAVDYSGYDRGFSPQTDHEAKVIRPGNGYAGNVDVKTLQDWIASIPGAEPMPCLNAGTGRPVDAAEWVRFSNFTHPAYHAKIWEIGNELDGSWEPGHFMLGSKLPIDADEYVRRYNAIAGAMKKIDPSVRIGGCAFAEAMIRGGGTNVDFASIHTYPGTTSATPQQNLANVGATVRKEVTNVRNWIRKYQPQREADIEISYTEWNLAGGLNASDMFSGLWHSLFLSEMAKNGVHFATQWDVFTHVKGMKSGHALIWTDGERHVRKAGFYAMWMWNNFTGKRILKSTMKGDSTVYSLVTRDDGAVYVQLVNPDEDREAVVSIDLKGFDVAPQGSRVALTSLSYFWDALRHEPVWSQPPQAETLACGRTFDVTLAPFSVTHLRLPSASGGKSDAQAAVAPATQASPSLAFYLPDEIYVGDRVAGYVLASASGATGRVGVAMGPARIESSEAGALDRTEVRLAEAAGRFFVTAKNAGSLTITATNDAATVTKTVKVLPSEPRAVVLWDFRKPELSDKETFSSELNATADPTVRANKDVARIELPAAGVTPSEKDKTRAMLIVKNFPKEIDRTNIRGVVFDVMGRNVSSEDPNASILVVMQSPANYWMVLGSVPLKDLEKWSTHEIVTSKQNYIDAMGASYNIWFVLGSSKPVKGTLYLDRIGLMVR